MIEGLSGKLPVCWIGIYFLSPFNLSSIEGEVIIIILIIVGFNIHLRLLGSSEIQLHETKGTKKSWPRGFSTPEGVKMFLVYARRGFPIMNLTKTLVKWKKKLHPSKAVPH